MKKVVKPFWDTIGLPKEELLVEYKKAVEQERVIVCYFALYQNEEFTPADIHERVLPHVLLTSVRRAITNLTSNGYLEKTGNLKPGPYGKPNHTWRLIKQPKLF